MTHFDQLVCRSAPWRWFAARVVLPWALQGRDLRGDVLEIGCGSGSMAAAALGRFPDVRITATDYDQSMVDTAQRRLAPFGDRAEVRQADATRLPFEDGSFDAALSFIMLHHVGAWEDAVAELVRVLRPGGVLIGYDFMGDRGRRVRRNRHDHVRRMRRVELEQRLGELATSDGAVRPSLGGALARFSAQRATAPG
jgi:ubiquinone/menaquinone biosynthesis C-methylase UbiE